MFKKSIALVAAVAAAVSCTATIAFAGGRPAVQAPVATVAPAPPVVDINDPNVPLAEGVKTVNVMKLQIGNKNISINNEDKALDVAPIIKNDRTMVPLRAIAEGLLAEVAWDGVTRTVTITRGTDTVIVVIDSNVMTVNGVPVTLDSAAFIDNDRTYVPTRAISEAFEATVEWNEAAQEVTVTTELDVDSKGEPTVVEPETTAEPEATVDPEATADPEATVDPEATADPEATVDPEATASPEATEAPAK